MKTFGKIAALAISLIFIIGIMVSPVNAAGNPEITVSDASGNIGDEVTVIISFTSNPGIAGFNADITYDKNNLELTDVSGNSGFGGSFMGNVSKSKFVWYNASNITSTGTFATLKFKIKDTAKPNTYEIGLSYSQGDMSNADGDDVTATIHAGKITVTCNHTYGSWEKNTAENHKHTCKVCGNVETAAHTWDAGKVTEAPTHTKEGTKTYTCAACGETKAEKVEKLKDHSYGEWTKHDDKQHKHSCICGDTQYAAHTWDNGKVTKAATCKDAGEKLYTCTACGETKTEAIAKTNNHTYGSWEKNTAENHKHTCKVCGNVETAAHTWDAGKVTEAPTHTKEGTKTYTCTVCGETKTEKVEKLKDHSYGEWTKHDDKQHKHSCICGDTQYAAHTWDAGKVTKAATCKDTGEKLYTCTACGEIKTEAIAKTNNHTYGSWEKNTAENHKHTCKVCGNVETAAHTWDAGKVTEAPTHTKEGTKTYTCTACGETKTEKVEKLKDHSYGEWTKHDDKQHKHSCICGDTQYAAHTWDAGKVTKAATCKDAGEKLYTCTACGETKTEAIAKTNNHTYGSWEKNTAENHKHTCKVCGNVETAAHTWDAGKVTKAATCKDTGEKLYTCTACGETKTEAIAKTNDHTYGSWEKNTAENHKHTCKVCGNVETAAHTWDNGKVTVKPTSTTKGQTVYTCTLCGETKTVETDYSHSHSYGIKWHYDNNMHWHECTGCGSKQTPRAHTFGEAKIITPATHTSTGKAEYKCTVCGAAVEKEIAKITEHNFGEWSAFDGEKHVRSCECGEKEYASHTAGEWETVKEATYTSTGEKVRKCTACGTVVSREEIPVKVKDTTKPVGTTTTNKTETTTTTSTSSTSAKQTETTKSTESKGCKSFVGVGASFTCVLAIGTALVLGKKKDD